MKADFEPAPPVPLELLDNLRRARKVLLTAHSNPDGDALGSMTALALGLNCLGIETKYLVAGRVADNLKFMLPPCPKLESLAELGDFQAVAILDCHLFERLGEDGPRLARRLKELGPSAPQVLVVDHHLADQPLMTELSYHVPLASSTGELIFNLLTALDVELSRAMAEALWVAITSDTGGFNFSNTTTACLRQASVLLQTGMEPGALSRRIMQSQPIERLKLLGRALEGIRLELSGRVAVLVVTEDMMARTGAKVTDTEGFVDYPRALAGVWLAALVYPTGEGRYKVSLRTREQVDVSGIAKFFGGGGHRQAAAYDDPGPPEAAVARLLAQAANELKRLEA